MSLYALFVYAGQVRSPLYASGRGASADRNRIPSARQGVGPLIAGWVAQYAGWRWVFWITFILFGVSFLGAVFILKETRGSIILSRRAARLTKETGRLHAAPVCLNFILPLTMSCRRLIVLLFILCRATPKGRTSGLSSRTRSLVPSSTFLRSPSSQRSRSGSVSSGESSSSSSTLSVLSTVRRMASVSAPPDRSSRLSFPSCESRFLRLTVHPPTSTQQGHRSGRTSWHVYRQRLPEPSLRARSQGQP